MLCAQCFIPPKGKLSHDISAGIGAVAPCSEKETDKSEYGDDIVDLGRGTERLMAIGVQRSMAKVLPVVCVYRSRTSGFRAVATRNLCPRKYLPKRLGDYIASVDNIDGGSSRHTKPLSTFVSLTVFCPTSSSIC